MVQTSPKTNEVSIANQIKTNEVSIENQIQRARKSDR